MGKTGEGLGTTGGDKRSRPHVRPPRPRGDIAVMALIVAELTALDERIGKLGPTAANPLETAYSPVRNETGGPLSASPMAAGHCVARRLSVLGRRKPDNYGTHPSPTSPR